MARNYTIHVTEKGISEKFKGATVIEPMVGVYYEPIAGLDFASLYPSIMMAYNMCYTTFIPDENTLNYVKDNGIPYETIEWETCDVKDCKGNCKHTKTKNSFSFVQIENNNGEELPNGVLGILGTILKKLMKGRKETKKLMNKEPDPFIRAIYDGKQLAQKVTMNSVYGFTGASNGFLPLKPIASSVTATGRKMIDKTSNFARTKFGAVTIYGDSIPPYEKITICTDRTDITDIPIEFFSNDVDIKWEEYRGFKVGDITVNNKEYKNLENSGYSALTHKGFQKIKKVIRHATTKKLYRIKARDSHGNIHQVIVTEGHSVISKTGESIRAEDLKIGDLLFEY
jgi:hypothetical protein